MSFQKQESPGRRQLLADGRAKFAALTAGAVLGSAAGVAVAGQATNSDPACQDPGRATRIVTTPTGAVLDCEAPVAPAPPETSSESAEVAPAVTTTTTEPTTPAVTTTTESTEPTEPTETTQTATPPPEAAVAAADPVAPAPQTAPATAPQRPSPHHVKPTGRPSKPGVHKTGKPAPGTVPTGVSPGAKAKAHAKVQAEHRAHAKVQARVKTRLQATARVRAKAKATADKRAGSSAAVYAALPPAWTSLAPIVLPAGDVEGFPIPPFLLPIYQAAAAQYGIPWEVLASINAIETDFGRNATVSSAGALGWMQFMPSTWERWGTDGDGDGRRDPRNPVDAIFAAARYLDGAGARTDLPKAIFAYNHSGAYVDQVVRRAREFAGLDETLVAALAWRALREDYRLYRAHGNPFTGEGAIVPQAGQTLLMSKRQLTHLVLRSKDITIYPAGRLDIGTGRVNRRVLATLLFLARSGLKPTVSSLETGHSRLTTAGNVSAHSYGHAVDISAINGIPILGHQGAGSITETTLRKLTSLQGYLRANQVISLMTIDGQSNTLSMGDHDDHIHVGFPRVPKVPGSKRPTDVAKLVATFSARRR